MLDYYLKLTNYPTNLSEYLVKGFTEGFDLGYRGPSLVKIKSPNLKFTIGDKTELWNKVMKEVKEKRYAGPYKNIPFEYFIQSPIGLVPKDGGTKTRLIFHLSYPKEGNTSINHNTPREMSTVEYPSFDDAVRLCIKHGLDCKLGKSDLTSAFRHLCMSPQWWRFLVMKAQSPLDDQWYYFVDKCMPFGSSISCAHFQAFSRALSHIVATLTREQNINYLDDFLFAAIFKALCDGQIHTFLKVCKDIRFPVSMEKTFWGTTQLTFLGLLIDTHRQRVFVPIEKVEKALNMVKYCLTKRSKKITLKELQQLCGFLNFLCKCIVPGRAFTRHLYTYGKHLSLPGHHLKIKSEMRLDLQAWESFLLHPMAYSRPFFHFNNKIESTKIDWYTDAAKNCHLGMGGICESEWFIAQWDEDFIVKQDPSINYLELYALTCAVYLWLPKYQNTNIIIYCDNESVVHMINSTSSKCVNCMALIRLIVLQGLTNNTCISAHHVKGELNIWADSLSHLKYKQFKNLAKRHNRHFTPRPRELPSEIWPVDKVWVKKPEIKQTRAAIGKQSR